MLSDLICDHDLVVTLEDGQLDGGFGERIALYYGNTDMKVLSFGLKKAFESITNPDDLLKENGISEENLISLSLPYIKKRV